MSKLFPTKEEFEVYLRDNLNYELVPFDDGIYVDYTNQPKGTAVRAMVTDGKSTLAFQFYIQESSEKYYDKSIVLSRIKNKLDYEFDRLNGTSNK